MESANRLGEAEEGFNGGDHLKPPVGPIDGRRELHVPILLFQRAVMISPSQAARIYIFSHWTLPFLPVDFPPSLSLSRTPHALPRLSLSLSRTLCFLSADSVNTVGDFSTLVFEFVILFGDSSRIFNSRYSFFISRLRRAEEEEEGARIPNSRSIAAPLFSSRRLEVSSWLGFVPFMWVYEWCGDGMGKRFSIWLNGIHLEFESWDLVWSSDGELDVFFFFFFLTSSVIFSCRDLFYFTVVGAILAAACAWEFLILLCFCVITIAIFFNNILHVHKWMCCWETQDCAFLLI